MLFRSGNGSKEVLGRYTIHYYAKVSREGGNGLSSHYVGIGDVITIATKEGNGVTVLLIGFVKNFGHAYNILVGTKGENDILTAETVPLSSFVGGPDTLLPPRMDGAREVLTRYKAEIIKEAGK